MSKKLVAYFSPTGTTRKIADLIAEIKGADIYEIKPAEHHNSMDLDWDKPNSRSSLEMADKNSRPEMEDKNANIESYDRIYLGFPIWWYVAPHIINSFLETYDFSGKTIVLFATSGGSGFGNTVAELKPSAPQVSSLIEGKVFRGRTSKDELIGWIETLKI